MHFLANYTIYKYNDQSWFFYETTFGKFLNVAFGSIDFLSGNLAYLFVKLFGAVQSINLLAIFYTLINLLCSYLLFQKLRGNRTFAVIFSFLYSFSIYFIFRVISFTPHFYLIFIFPLTLYLLLKGTRPVFLGMLTFFFLCLSSYYAFFNAVVVGLWYLMDRKPLGVLKFAVPLIIGTVLVFLPYLKQNTYLGSYDNGAPMTNYRPIEDWYNFSFRPWYFVIPPGSSLFFGDLHNAFYDKIKSTGNYLTQNYSEDEMAGSYMGWHFILGALFVVFHVFFRKDMGTKGDQLLIKRCFWIILVIMLISGPPSLNLLGVKIYTPSYLMYYIVPIFRSLSRWASVLYLLILIINYPLVLKMYSSIQKRLFKVGFVLFFVLLNFVVFAIKVPVINIQNPPEDVVALKNLDGRSLVFYPEADFYNLFWSQVYKKEIINPKGITVLDQPSKEFTSNLLTGKGLDLLAKSDTKYLIYNKNRDAGAEPALNKLYGLSKEAGSGFFIYSIH